MTAASTLNAHRRPDLRLHRVLGCAVEAFDPQVLLDSFEKQLNLPTLFVERGDGCGG